MFNRPRCRDWTPLATQQLRLRNLIQISGHNIQCDGSNCSIYFTLHFTSMSAPFFTSEKLDIRKIAIWPEINCPTIFKSTAHSVCIRVWQHNNEPDECDTNTADKVLFLWGVYFSGLVPISKRTDVKLNKNSLVFHIHGGFFTSADCLLFESIPHQLEVFGIENVYQKIFQTAEQSCDQSVILSRKTVINLESEKSRKINSRSTSPDEHQLSSALDKSSVSTEISPDSLKVKFLQKNFFKTEIRRSYDVAKLLQLQEKQRQFRNKSESAKEVMDKICMKSAFCLNLELIANKKFLLRPRGNPSMGRTLNRLLFQQQEQLKPEELLKAQAMRRKIETAKFRCRLLLQEKNQALINIRKLEQKLGVLIDLNIDQETWLMSSYRELGKDRTALIEFKGTCSRKLERNDELLMTLRERQQQILRELKEIYCIKRSGKGIYSINGAALPTAEVNSESVSPSDISVALGYAAHVTLMCSVILDCPLRNAIIYRGSASLIKDNTKVMPDSERDFPLFCRHNPPPEPLLYAVYLLNQNISQMKYMLELSKDMRAILPNLLQLLNGSPQNMMVNNNSSNSALVDLPKNSSLDLHHIPVNGLFPTVQGSSNDNRVSRSVETYPNNESISKLKINFVSEPVLCAKSLQLRNFSNENDGNV